MAYIYKIVNDINNKIYVGKTEFSIEKRFQEHCRDCLKRKNEHRPLYAAMRKYGIEHFKVELVEETNNPETQETYWIEYFDSYHNGYNATLGGDGKKYIDYNLVITTYQNLGCIKDVADKLNICEDSVRHILQANNIQINSSQDISKKRSGIPVNMYSLNDELLCQFASAREAAQYLIDNQLTNCKLTTIRTHIGEVCKGRRLTAAKFKWKY